MAVKVLLKPWATPLASRPSAGSDPSWQVSAFLWSASRGHLTETGSAAPFFWYQLEPVIRQVQEPRGLGRSFERETR